MGDVLTFTPRPKLATPEAMRQPAEADLRASLEEAAQTALDTAHRLIAVLDHLDGDPDLEDGADAEPSLAAPENHEGSQVVRMRGGDDDRETEAPETALPEVAVDGAADANVIHVPPLRWGGHGNVIAAAGSALLDLAGVR